MPIRESEDIVDTGWRKVIYVKPLGQYLLNIPKNPMKALGWKKGDYVVLEINENLDLIKIRKTSRPKNRVDKKSIRKISQYGKSFYIRIPEIIAKRLPEYVRVFKKSNCFIVSFGSFEERDRS